MNREFAERQKEWKDVEKRHRERKRKDKEAQEKENRVREKEVKSPLLLPDTTPEPKSSSSAEGEVVYSMLPDPDTEGAGGQSPDQQRAGTEPPTQAEGEGLRVQSLEERSPVRPDAGTLERVSPPRPHTGPGAAPSRRLARANGSA